MPDIPIKAHDTRGQFRKRDIAPLNLAFELDDKERNVMLFIWKTMYKQIITPKMRDEWIQNQGEDDYKLTVKNYEDWITSLE